MITYKYYRFPSKDIVPRYWPNNVNVSEVGLLLSHPGWHINVCYQGKADLSHIQEYEITVQTPTQIWYGQ